MKIKRREFLQGVGWALAGLGISEAQWWGWSDRYSQVLAQPTNRKLALLVGINQYPDLALAGCLTDVELQQELLINRFGFQPEDIIILTNKEATKNNIKETFTSHLIQQAKPGDVAIFHFSGYGSRIKFKEELGENQVYKLKNFLVAVDSPIAPDTVGNELLEENLYSLLVSIPTENAIAILDTSYIPSYITQPNSLLGNLKIRSRLNPSILQISKDDLILPNKLPQKSDGKSSRVILTAAGENQVATEGQWNGFNAGLFTYSLTQQLWIATPETTLRYSFDRAAEISTEISGKYQQPEISQTDLNIIENPDKILNTSFTSANFSALGVVTSIIEGGKTGKIWLGGISPIVLDSYNINSILSLIPINNSEENTEKNLIQIRSRDGLTAQVSILGEGKMQVGQLVQEYIRVVPDQIYLKVALDNNLKRIERVDATSAFSIVPQVKSIVVTDTPQPADYLFGRVEKLEKSEIDNAYAQSSVPLPSLPQVSYGLFSLGQELIPNTMGEGGEAVKSAVQRVIPQLQTLRANKLLRLTENADTSRLPVGVSLEIVTPEAKILLQRQTLGVLEKNQIISNQKYKIPKVKSNGVVSLATGSKILYKVQNYSDVPVYYIVFGLDSAGRAIALYCFLPEDSDIPTDTNIIKTKKLNLHKISSGETLTIPNNNSTWQWTINSPKGLVETQIIFSIAPFHRAIGVLETGIPIGNNQQIGVIAKPLEFAQAVLQDLHAASNAANKLGVTSDDFVLDVNAWASFNLIYRIV